MIRALLFISFFLTVSASLSVAQSDPTLKRATPFTVLAATEIVNNAVETGVTGNVGVYPGNTIIGEERLVILQGRAEKGTAAAAVAMEDANAAYSSLSTLKSGARQLPSTIGTGTVLTPGAYKISGGLTLQGVLTLDGLGNENDPFFIFVDGNLLSESSNAGVITQGRAHIKNLYWIVSGEVNLGSISGMKGNILAKQDIKLNGVVVEGRVMSLEGKVVFNGERNNLFLPSNIYPDLNVTKTAPTKEYRIGDQITYTIVVNNAGPGSATNVVVAENFPTGLQYVPGSAVSSGGVFNESNYTWSIGFLQFGQSRELKLTFEIIAPGTIKNNVSVDADETDPNPNDNDDDVTIEVPLPAANMSVVKAALAGEYAVGGQVTYTVTARNAGPGAAEGVVVQENIPDGLTLVSAVTLKGNYDRATNRWTVGGLANDESALLTLVFTINKPGTLVNGVTVVADNTDPNPGDNSSESPINVPCTALNVAVTGNATVCVGEEKTYTTPANLTASSYNWSFPGDWIVLEGKDTNSVTVRVGRTAGEVAVTVNNLCNSNKSATLSVTVNDKLAAPLISGSLGACIGERLTYTIPAVTGATGYAWAVPATWTLVSGQNSRSIIAEVGAGEGQVTVSIINACGAGSSATLDVAPVLAPIETNTIVGNASVCEYGDTVTYTLATVEEGVAYTWAIPANWTMVAGQGTGTITVNTTATAGTVSVSAKNSCGTAQTITKDVSVTVPPVSPATIIDKSNACGGLSYTIDAVQGATGYTWTVPAGFTITSGQGTTTINVKADPNAVGEVTVAALNGNCSSVAASAKIDVSLADGQLGFPKAFSPNGDGKNDTWWITNLEKYPANEVTIFNRWGSEVYKTINYQNDWSASKLEKGTYFYKVRVTVCDGVVKEFTGYTTLFR